MPNFDVILPLTKNVSGDLEGWASSLAVDRDDERMSEKALNSMVSDIKREGCNLFTDHDHKVDNIVGFVKDAELIDNKVKVKIILDDANTNPRVNSILGKLNKGCKLGLSVGGNVTATRWEYDRKVGKKIKILDDVKIYEVSVVGIPSNSDSFISLPGAIAKSAKFTKRCPVCYADMHHNLCEMCFLED